MALVFQIVFAFLLALGGFLFYKRIMGIRRNILLGGNEVIEPNASKRLSNLLLLAFGQKKMFRNPLVAVMHFVIYAGFIIINIEVLEIVLDGLLGTHRLFAPFLGGFYNFLINCFEILALGVLVVCVIFLVRRNMIKLKRFASNDLKGWPKSDANYILIVEIILMSLFLIMNAADNALQVQSAAHYIEHPTGPFIISKLIAPVFINFSQSGLIILERVCWWLHIIGILAFLNYLPYSKHLHILLAFPNAYYARPEGQGKMENMPVIQKEVILAMGGNVQDNPILAALPDAVPVHFGAKDVQDLSWKNLMDAYSCTECGRCSTACPATSTGKALSPRLIMMKTRDRLEEVGKQLDEDKIRAEDGKTLLHDYVTVEELRACTTCNACVTECPVSISPLDIIIKLRRYLILDESNSPAEWNAMYSNIENNAAPWKFSPEERGAWIKS